MPGGMLRYARAKIDTIDHGLVTADACDSTSDGEDAVEKRCWEYSIEMPPVAVADVAGLFDRGAIVEIWRGGDPMKPYEGVAGAFVLVAIANGLLAWRAAKRSRNDPDRLPRAEIAR